MSALVTSLQSWLPQMMKADDGPVAMDSPEALVTHRRRLAQILRYIASMHHSLQSEGVGPSFVQEGRQERPPADFFQTDEEQSEWILFSTADFRSLLNVEQNSQTGPLFKSPPFSFYATVTDQQERKRTFTGAFKKEAPKDASVNAKNCWMRITRLTNAQIATTPPESLRRPAVREYLDGWLAQTPGVHTIKDLLTLERLNRAPKLPPNRDARHKQEIHNFLSHYRQYLRRRTYHNILEPMYNHLFEWVQQQSDEELVFGLGHARCYSAATGTWISSPVLEVLVEVEVSRRDGSLLLRPRDHTGVTLHRPFLAALPELAQATVAQLHQKVAEVEPLQLCPGQPQTYVPLLQEIAVQVAADGSFHSSARAKLDDPSKLVVTEAWCLFRRPKPSSVWARDATKFADKIMMENATDSTCSLNLPLAAWALTFGPQAVEQKRRELIQQNAPPKGLLDRFFAPKTNPQPAQPKPLFPLPTSGPQSRIAELLFSGYPAVVCSGPPGSGKSHTSTWANMRIVHPCTSLSNTFTNTFLACIHSLQYRVRLLVSRKTSFGHFQKRPRPGCIERTSPWYGERLVRRRVHE